MNADTADLRREAGRQFQALVDWTAAHANTPLPQPVMRRAAVILADDIGAIIAGSQEPQVRRARETAISQASGRSEATIFASGAGRVDRATAAAPTVWRSPGASLTRAIGLRLPCGRLRDTSAACRGREQRPHCRRSRESSGPCV